MDSKKTIGLVIDMIIRQVALWFVSAIFIWWGWNVFAGHFNLPQFEYMEVFAMRVALTYIIDIFGKKLEKLLTNRKKSDIIKTKGEIKNEFYY